MSDAELADLLDGALPPPEWYERDYWLHQAMHWSPDAAAERQQEAA